jgi:hypothetical protein
MTRRSVRIAWTSALFGSIRSAIMMPVPTIPIPIDCGIFQTLRSRRIRRDGGGLWNLSFVSSLRAFH